MPDHVADVPFVEVVSCFADSPSCSVSIPDGCAGYRRLHAQSLAAFLEREGRSAVEFAELLENVDAAVPAVEAMRRAGFVVGFDLCRQLLLGELNLDSLKDGAR
jgi:hypothetical protein